MNFCLQSYDYYFVYLIHKKHSYLPILQIFVYLCYRYEEDTEG